MCELTAAAPPPQTPQGGSVNCDSSGLVDPLKIGVKSHTASFTKESLRGLERLVSDASLSQHALGFISCL